MHLARLEMEILLEALVELVDRIEGENPRYSDNRGLYGIIGFDCRIYG